MAVSASAEVAIPGYVSSPSVASSAVSEPASTPAPTSSPEISDSPLDEDTTYTPAEIAEILREHPNAFTTASDPEAEADTTSGAADQSDADGMQTVDASDILTIWDKPFNSYSPTEGYLLLLTVLVFSMAAFKLVKYLWL